MKFSTGKHLLLLILLWSSSFAFVHADTITRLSKNELQFLVIGDWGRYGSKNQVRVAGQMDNLAITTAINFIATTGDNFYPKGVQDVDDSHWEGSYRGVYTLPHLQDIPWFPTLGNHDYMGNIHAQFAFSSTSRRWQFPGSYYSRHFMLANGNRVDLFFLDTNPLLQQYQDRPGRYHHIDEQDPGRQLSWLYHGLRKSTAKWRIALGHHPVFSAGYHGDSNELADQLLRLFEKYRVQAYFAGHDHHLEHYSSRGLTQYYISGAGSRVRSVTPGSNTRFSAATPGFAHVKISPVCMWTSFINSRGETLYQSSQSFNGTGPCNSAAPVKNN